MKASSGPSFGRSTIGESLRIRPALLHERGRLEALQLRASLANPNDRESLLANPDVIELPDDQINSGRVCVAEIDTAICGFAVGLPRADGNTELDGLFVEPALWGKGIGRALVDHCARQAKRDRSATLNVIGNPHAESFYRACGFEPLGTVQTRFGPALLMRRAL